MDDCRLLRSNSFTIAHQLFAQLGAKGEIEKLELGVMGTLGGRGDRIYITDEPIDRTPQ